MRCARAILVPVFGLMLSSPAAAELPIQQWRTDSGARVLFVESRSLPMLDVAVEFPAGSSLDQAETSGLASLTLRLMRMGTRSMSEDQISERLADVGAGLSPRFDVDRAGYALRTLSSEPERTVALRVLREVLQAPGFSREAVEREKSRVVSALREAEIQPATIAEREFRELIFGSHPYALAPSGRPETVAALSPDAVSQFYRRHYTAEGAVVAIIGDVDVEEARSIANALTEVLASAQSGDVLPPPVDSLSESIQRFVPHPATQAHVRIGMPGMSRGDPDYYPLWLGNHIFGGSGFTSRLTGELRQKRGLSYSSYSYFAPYLRPGPFAIGVQTRKDQAAEAVQVIHRALQEFVVSGPTEEELEAAKQNIIGGFVLRVDSNGKILEYLSMIGFYRLPLDYVDRFPERIAAVTRAQVVDAFKRRIDPERMITVVVGPAAPL
jgi:zinc protease